MEEYNGTVSDEYRQSQSNNEPRRTESMNIRRNRHYGFRVASGPKPTVLCCNPKCDKSVDGRSVIIDGLIYHEGCWPVTE